MEKEEMRLLINDLSLRLGNGVILNCCGDIGEKLISISDGYNFDTSQEEVLINNDYDIYEVKPYLIPIDKMTDNDKKELEELIEDVTKQFMCFKQHELTVDDKKMLEIYIRGAREQFMYFKHYDINNLISKNLALEAPEELYK
jgi:hypothetical protein